GQQREVAAQGGGANRGRVRSVRGLRCKDAERRHREGSSAGTDELPACERTRHVLLVQAVLTRAAPTLPLPRPAHSGQISDSWLRGGPIGGNSPGQSGTLSSSTVAPSERSSVARSSRGGGRVVRKVSQPRDIA